MALLVLHEVTKRFGGLTAVDRCSFAVEAGTITGLIGPNGAGKTTVFNLISGLLKPDGGKILFAGEELNGKPPHFITRKGIARTFQIAREFEEMTVLENVIIHSPTRGLPDLLKGSVLKEEREKAMALLEFVGIAHLASEEARKLSYGQKKLLELACALMADPKLILLDEPAGGVNPRLLERIMERIETLHRQGTTFLIIEHKMDLVMGLCNPVIVMAYGRVLAKGSPEEIQEDPRVLDAYLGAA
ncbi:MAG: ABC transporter ATP-binding protein [Armatimonadota bacterium]|nr:ABC transporter ATP-binding protein [Armatimonadota bacterium]MDR5703529.1 ABC transporter ATP-binding protein [Armatimonadota bacterium]